MSLNLPSYQELSREQDRVLNIPLDENCIVTGPPGTGKTVVAIYRTEQLARRSRRPTIFLVYNWTLALYLREALRERRLSSHTKRYNQWVWRLGITLTGEPPPTKAGDQNEGFKPIDWLAFIQKCPDPIPVLNQQHLVLDEAQDFEPFFFRLLPRVAPSFSIFADENQRITNTNSRLQDIRAITAAPEYRLARNYRNTAQIHDVAAQFFAGVDTGIAERPAREGSLPLVYAHQGLESQVEQVARYERTFADRQIGVFLPNIDLLHTWRTKLEAREPRHPLQWYHSGLPIEERLPFSGPGIKLLAYPSVKGLEFDTVFLPCLEHRGAQIASDDPIAVMRFYVLVSRARDALFMLWTRPTADAPEPSALQRIPPDLAERRDYGDLPPRPPGTRRSGPDLPF